MKHATPQHGERSNGAPLVSAIIIFLDGEKFIAEAIESIIAQTMTDWELILVDDGSTDGATEIAKRYAREYPGKISYTEHPGHENRGMSASRNAGLRLARGKYVGFLDADDIWMPEHLRVNCRILEENEHVVREFFVSRAGSGFIRDGQAISLPWETGHDGGAAFRLRRR